MARDNCNDYPDRVMRHDACDLTIMGLRYATGTLRTERVGASADCRSTKTEGMYERHATNTSDRADPSGRRDTGDLPEQTPPTQVQPPQSQGQAGPKTRAVAGCGRSSS